MRKDALLRGTRVRHRTQRTYEGVVVKVFRGVVLRREVLLVDVCWDGRPEQWPIRWRDESSRKRGYKVEELQVVR